MLMLSDKDSGQCFDILVEYEEMKSGHFIDGL